MGLALMLIIAALLPSICNADEITIDLGTASGCWGTWGPTFHQTDVPFDVPLSSASIDSIYVNVSGVAPSENRMCFVGDHSFEIPCILQIIMSLEGLNDVAGPGTFAGIELHPQGVFSSSIPVLAKSIEYPSDPGSIIPPTTLSELLEMPQVLNIIMTDYDEDQGSMSCSDCIYDKTCLELSCSLVIVYSNHVGLEHGTWSAIKAQFR